MVFLLGREHGFRVKLEDGHDVSCPYPWSVGKGRQGLMMSMANDTVRAASDGLKDSAGRAPEIFLGDQ